ncbi:threonine--tRNA ligase [Candidatus Phytoplasma bonamiae]|uniref:Threonine--tRNA ligase n=1 Tax=Candidatus Phytoplasma bonamiae TaxID=2982626 RepID=A0ABT9D6Z4_9MOLU|nr:threonine--tRNA ligase ['Bonamia sp.' little leaf phytoplasma]MDO8064004.1 threonine--tRNA ligase ['Bonamia sp.' little leaf phytoplasma]MDV3174518.1 threonine--tRNA ligase ['Bonamia sp.' little leaf phytoplasma]
MIEIEYQQNNQKKRFPNKITVSKIIASENLEFLNNSEKLPIAAYFNNKLVNLDKSLTEDGLLNIITISDSIAWSILNNNTSLIMAQAICRIYPNSLLVNKSINQEGFYYDIDPVNNIISEQDFSFIEKTMIDIIQENLPITETELSVSEIRNFFKFNPYKIDYLKNIDPSQKLFLYQQGNFSDFCTEDHYFPNININRYFKILKTSGVYWQGNKQNKVLTRLYGVAFFRKRDLSNYLKVLDERKKRDHKFINKEQNFFMFSPVVGTGLPFWLSKGATIRRIIERYIVDKEISYGYQHVYTPVVANISLYKTSGHLKLYNEDMFPIMQLPDGEQLILRPMNCPHHMEIFRQKMHSYKDLPIKIAELGLLHRYEPSGAVSGLQRVRAMSLNDAHIFITPEQIKQEFAEIINLIKEVYQDFHIQDYYFNLSTHDPAKKNKYFDDPNMWLNSENILRDILNELGLNYKEKIGDAAFYGPKVDVQVLTALNHEITLSTIQLDFLLPKRFNLSYIDCNNQTKTPVVIHRAITSTIERFTAYLIEQHKGFFPLWIAPVQVIIIPVNNELHLHYVKNLQKEMLRSHIRAELNDKEYTFNYKIRSAYQEKIPFQIIIGENEIKNHTLHVRQYNKLEKINMSMKDFLEMFFNLIKNKM